ncbi:GntR family transcriptional regulator [Neomicrococcus lactis]|uniref:DNA-binding GntR family transcriptional regulator n=1 Tax=Neomicrococcus lactis TaxID=732241 RepID=A0A7W8YCD7_9MICC|nr:GntR family transcriptional regulator [Neomicrococcus lactis]MBB5598973.1 DNA-binding GntR family transcriptional regulator [Neomicrococcus lactis]
MNSTEETGGYVSLAERAYEILRDRLVMLEIPPGAPINEGALAAELGIGRTPIRESLKKLEVDHLVVSYPRRGTFATAVDIKDLASISDVRRALEPLAAARAATNAPSAIRQKLLEKAEQIESLDVDAMSNRDLLEYDLAVHRLIYSAVDNPHMEEPLVRLDNLVTRIWVMVFDRLPSVGEHVREHSTLLRTIVAGDADKAEQLVRDHVQNFEMAMRRAL